MNSEPTTIVNIVKRQRAFIRTLNDEAARYSRSDARGAALREQLREEKARAFEVAHRADGSVSPGPWRKVCRAEYDRRS